MILIHNINILTMNEKMDIIENGIILIEGKIIKYIGDNKAKRLYENKEGIRIIDGNNGIAMPGMINCHCHGAMVHFRSLADDHKDRLKKYLFPLEKKHVDKKFVYDGSRYAIAELLLSGVTSFSDMYYFEDEVAKAAKDMGIRAVLCETVVDFPSPDSKEAFGGLEYAKEFIEKWKNDELITPGIAPHAIYTNNDESLLKAYKIAKEYDVPMQMHVAEMDYELSGCIEKTGLTPVGYLDKLGVLDSRFIAAHSILVNDDDIEILKKRKVKISHNIGANAKGAKGVMPIMKFMDKGIEIGLGSDGPMSGNTLDIISQMSQVGKIHKLFNNDRTILKASEIMKMATIGGAKVLGLDKKVGSLEVGKIADIAIFETDSINMNPIYDYYSTIVYSANPSNVDAVIVNGKIVVKNKKLLTANVRELREKLLKLCGV